MPRFKPILSGLLLFSLFLYLTMTLWGAEQRKPVPKQRREPVKNLSEKLPEEYNAYIGTYTGSESKGIYRCRFNAKTGEISQLELAVESVNPSFLAIHSNRKFLYAVNEVGDYGGQPTGAVSAFAIDPDSGALTLLNQQASGGSAPCHLVVDATGKHVLVANYTGGSVAAFPIGEDGRLGSAASVIQHAGSSINPSRQQGPHAHSINLDPANRFAFAADLGLDQVLVYRFDAARGSLTPHNPPSVSVEPGAGPRHFSFHPSGRYAYVINELASTVTAFSYDAARGVLKPFQSLSSLPADFEGESYTAEVLVHPSGEFVYGSNRGHDSIAVFRCNEKTGRLSFVEAELTGGKTPRNFHIDPTGRFLLAANQTTNNIVVFRIDQKSGKLTPTGHDLHAPSPVCIRMLPVRK